MLVKCLVVHELYTDGMLEKVVVKVVKIASAVDRINRELDPVIDVLEVIVDLHTVVDTIKGALVLFFTLVGL